MWGNQRWGPSSLLTEPYPLHEVPPTVSSCHSQPWWRWGRSWPAPWGGWGGALRWRTVLKLSWWDSSDGLLVAELAFKYCWFFEVLSWKYHYPFSRNQNSTCVFDLKRDLYGFERRCFFLNCRGESESNWMRRTSATGQLVGQRRRKRRSRDASWRRAWTRYLIRPAITIHMVRFYGLGIYTLDKLFLSINASGILHRYNPNLTWHN